VAHIEVYMPYKAFNTKFPRIINVKPEEMTTLNISRQDLVTMGAVIF
jgi:hypothetical protein